MSRGWYFPDVLRDRQVELAYLGIVLLLVIISHGVAVSPLFSYKNKDYEPHLVPVLEYSQKDKISARLGILGYDMSIPSFDSEFQRFLALQ